MPITRIFMTNSDPARPGGRDLSGEEVMSTIYACAHATLPNLVPQPTAFVKRLGVSIDSHQASVEARLKPSESVLMLMLLCVHLHLMCFIPTVHFSF